MDAKDFALELRDTLLGMQNEGATTLQTENMVAYLNEAIASMDRLPSQPSTADIELYKANLQKWIEEHKNVYAHQVEMFRAVIAAGQNALRSAFLMNAGGAVAVLTFIGNLANNDPQRIPSLAPSLTVFVSGVLLVTVASGATYLSQWFYAHLPKWGSYTGHAFNILAIVCAIASYCAFAWGIHDAYTVFASYGPTAGDAPP